MKRLMLCLGLCAAMPVLAASDIHQLFMQALAQGEAMTPLPNPDPKLVKALQAMTHSTGEIVIKAQRVVQFKQQSQCGRIGFVLYQPSTSHSWPETGGQLNVCLDGLPPQQQCGSSPSLVPMNQPCTAGQKRHNTAEVQQAIDDAVAKGSLLFQRPAVKSVKKQEASR